MCSIIIIIIFTFARNSRRGNNDNRGRRRTEVTGSVRDGRGGVRAANKNPTRPFRDDTRRSTRARERARLAALQRSHAKGVVDNAVEPRTSRRTK